MLVFCQQENRSVEDIRAPQLLITFFKQGTTKHKTDGQVMRCIPLAAPRSAVWVMDGVPPAPAESTVMQGKSPAGDLVQNSGSQLPP